MAVSAMRFSSNPHSFFGINDDGVASIIRTKGNKNTHVILRGGLNISNYDKESVTQVSGILKEHDLCSKILIDCSHGNSKKSCKNQPHVFREILEYLSEERGAILGMMLESYLFEGNQKFDPDTHSKNDSSYDPKNTAKSKLQYGVSITDECIDWKTTVALVEEAL